MDNTQIQKTNTSAQFAAMLKAESVQQQFKNALGNHKDAFIASLIDLYNGDAALRTCNPSALCMEALRAATLKLPLNKALGFAYIVVYNNSVKRTDESGNEVLDPNTHRPVYDKVPTPTFIPGYKGYIQLAMRTGQYRTINADVVYEGEVRKANKLTGEITFDGEKTSDKIVGYFCYFELLNGFSKTLYMTVEDMAKYAKRYSPSVGYKTTIEQLMTKANDGIATKKVGWEGNFNDMALKGLSLDTLIPTPDGFITMGEIQVGDKLYNALGEETKVIAKSEVKHLPCYEIEFQNGETFICDEEHRWLVKGKGQKQGEWHVMETKDMYAARLLGYSINIPNNPQVEFIEKDLPTDPYCLGYWLGNGASKAANVTCLDTDADEISSQFEKHFSVSKRYDGRSNGCCLNISAKNAGPFITQLKSAGVYGNKHIPDLYKRGSIQQRIALIQGLCDSDGSIDKQRHRVTYISVRQELIEDMYEVLSSLGEKCYTASYIARGFGKETRVWAIGWLPSYFNPFRLKRKAERVKERETVETTSIKSIHKISSVPTQCIAVDCGDASDEADMRKTFLIGTGFKVTHNTVVRRLLSKYGYLSVEMQGAMAKDIEASDIAERNDIIDENANKTILPENVSYEDITDKETGEIKPANTNPNPATADAQQPRSADDEPGY